MCTSAALLAETLNLTRKVSPAVHVGAPEKVTVDVVQLADARVLRR